MPLSQIFTIIQIILAVLLSASVLLQNKNSGLGSAFGGNDAVVFQRRGPEKTLFIITIILAILFFGISIATLFV